MDVRTLAVAVAAALAPAAQDPLEVRGVRAENAPAGGVTITFTARAAALHRRIAGLRTIVRCQAAVAGGPLLLPLDRANELFADTRTPRARRTLRIRGAAGRRFDVCELTALRRLRTVRSLAVPLTAAGAEYLDARRLGERMVAVLVLVSGLGSDGRYPAASEVDVPRLVALATPDATPPAGRIGLYSDAAQHVTVVAVTPAGRRLFVDADGGLVTSNVPELVLAGR